MKRLKSIFKTICLFILCLLPTTSAMSQNETEAMDSVELSLLTCQPHNEIYSLYGHSALRYHDLRTKEDIVFNYGVFNYKAPHFVLRFIFGLTDYELGIAPFDGFCAYYRRWGSMIVEQKLNLTNEEKFRIKRALAINLRPENRIYRYNFFYDNCSTRPRNIIESQIEGKIVYEPRQDYEPSFREMIHQYTKEHPWAAFGNDLLLGIKADLKTTRSEQEFLPDNLMFDFDHARIQGADGKYRPLIKERNVVVPSGVQTTEGGFPLSPLACALILLAVSLVIAAIEYKHKSIYWVVDVIWMLAQGLAGCIIFVMLFSQHPTTSTNLQILLLNPIPLFFIHAAVRKHHTSYFRLLAVMIALFLVGAFFQDYAEGMEVLALCLLLRCCIHFKNEK